MTATSGETSSAGVLAWFRQIAMDAAAKGAAIVAAGFGRSYGGESKGAGDYVTDVDRESEGAVRRHLLGATPNIPVLAEEGGGERGRRYWVVDPLDGTTNFLLGFPAVAVAVCLMVEGRPMVSAIQAPLLEQSFWAVRGGGAWSGAGRLRVSARPPDRAVVATALPFRVRSSLPRYLPVMEEVFTQTEDLRRVGSASLDLAWVAAGVFDGYFELHLAEWDVAPGGLLVEEAGGVVSDWGGGPNYMSGHVLAGSPATHAVLLEAVRRAGSAG